MANDFEKILDECIDRVNRGQAIESCLADHPEYAEQIGPLLQMMSQTKEAYEFTPSDDAKRTARLKLHAAIDKRKESFWQRWLNRRTVLATVASVVVLMVLGYVGLHSTVLSPEPSIYVAAAPNPEGNFAFLVSDEVNAIGDFNSLNITIDKVNLLQKDSPDKWIEFSPETKEFDLTLLPGDKTQELWKGNIPEGQYTDIVIYVSKVLGVLKSTDGTIEIKLPSNKLRMSKPFEVNPNSNTSFVYDLTVVKAGNAQNGEKYLLKPQVDASGTNQPMNPINAKPKESHKK